MTTLVLFPHRELTAKIRQLVLDAADAAKLKAFSSDGNLSLGTDIISSDGDIAAEITIHKDGRVKLFWSDSL